MKIRIWYADEMVVIDVADELKNDEIDAAVENYIIENLLTYSYRIEQ